MTGEKHKEFRLDGAALLATSLVGLAALAAAISFAYVPPNLPTTCGEDCANNLDLVAQTSMASAAWFMAAMAAISTIAGVITLVLILLTLREAKRSADAGDRVVEATLAVGKRQVRAYLAIENASIKFDVSEATITFAAQARNTGQSPAHNITISTHVRLYEEWSDPEGDIYESDILDFSEVRDLPAASATQSHPFGAYKLMFLEPLTLKEVMDRPYLFARVTCTVHYTDVFGDEETFVSLFRKYIDLNKVSNDGIALNGIA